MHISKLLADTYSVNYTSLHTNTRQNISLPYQVSDPG